MNEIGCYLKKIHNQLENDFNRKFKKYDLTSTQLDVLEYLAQHADADHTLSDIAAYFDVRHTSMIHVLKLLEGKGFICRSSTSADSRAKPVSLTDRGRQIVLDVSKSCPAFHQQMFSGISDEEQKLLARLLDQIYKNLNADAFKEL